MIFDVVIQLAIMNDGVCINGWCLSRWLIDTRAIVCPMVDSWLVCQVMPIG